MSNRLLLGEEVRAKNLIRKYRLILFGFFRSATNLLSIFIFNDDRLVVFGKRPETHVAVKAATLASRTLRIVALLTQWLPIVVLILSASGTRNTMVRREFNCRFRLSAMRTLVSSLNLQSIPERFCWFCTRFALHRSLCGYELVLRTLLDNAGKALLALQFAHSAKRIDVQLFPRGQLKRIYYLSDFSLTNFWARNSMSLRP